jgi:TolA-binding protein
LAVALASFAIVGCATAPEEDPVYIRMNDLDARVQRIERVLTNQSLLELAQRIDSLQADLRTIRGEVELLQNETQGGKTQTRNLYGDLGPNQADGAFVPSRRAKGLRPSTTSPRLCPDQRHGGRVDFCSCDGVSVVEV